jgi:ABC-2 type transport system permease protein
MPKRALRLLSFLVKEVLDVLQQPRLVITLIVGPFLILLVFGLGFIGKQGPVSAVVVVPPGAELPFDLEERVARYADFLPIRGFVESREEAVAWLESESVEMAVLLPTTPEKTFLAGGQIVIEVLTHEYDPIRDQWLIYVSGFMATDLNEQLRSDAVKQVRTMAARLQGISTALLDRLLQVGASLEVGDVERVKAQLDDLLVLAEESVQDFEPSLETWLGTPVLADSVRGAGGQPTSIQGYSRAFRDAVRALRQLVDDPALDPTRVLDQLASLRSSVVRLQAMASLLEEIPDSILVSPVSAQVQNLSPSAPDYMHFYAPAVLALLMQHIAVTFGALTMVRERLLGAEELFRVSPIAPWEILTGKFASYGLLTVVVGLVLSILVVLALGVPLLGRAWAFGLVLILVTAAGLGWGFFVSLLSNGESQAVQFAMLLLVAAVFFGGFFVDLSGLRPEVHYISYALPVTYGVRALREVMLAGRLPALGTWLPLLGMSAGLYGVSVLLYTWQHKRE